MTDLPSREVFANAYDHLITRTGGYIDIDESDPEFAAYRALMKLHYEGRLVEQNVGTGVITGPAQFAVERGHRVLIIDLDKIGNESDYYSGDTG